MNHHISKREALNFFQGSFAKLSVDHMFRQISLDNEDTISYDEYLKFWAAVKKADYTDQEVQDEVDAMIQGQTWRDWGTAIGDPVSPLSNAGRSMRFDMIQ